MSNSTPKGQSLSPSQQNLLYTALASNQRAASLSKINGTNGTQHQSPLSADPSVFTSPSRDPNGQLTDSPLFDQFDDNALDLDNHEQLFGDIDDYEQDYEEDGDLHDKRKAFTNSNDGDHKRQEGESKIPKKPGRKPITEQPTTKRKAQNRAAQRAFRERKEKHLKDLEVKVDDLEKASEATNHENGRLRAQVDKLSTEVKEYRKRLSMNNVGDYSPITTQSRNPYENNEFSYAFPKFGDLPKSFMENGSIAKTSNVQSQITRSPSGPVRQTSSNAISPTTSVTNGDAFGIPKTASPGSFTRYEDASLNELTGLFSPAVLQSVSRSNSTDYNFPSSASSTGGTSVKGGSISNNFNGNGRNNSSQHNPHRASSASTMNSPASSQPFDSSVGTTPEPSGDNAVSPEPVTSMTKSTTAAVSPSTLLRTINEESSSGAPSSQIPAFKSPSSDSFNSIDWMAAQNGGAFDPVLFDDYRDPQDSILNGLGDDFFGDAIGGTAGQIDFSSPYNTGDLMPSEPKRDLMTETEAANGDETVQLNGNRQNDAAGLKDGPGWLGPSEVWNRMQASPGYDDKNKEEIDILCSQFKNKAQCSGKRAVVAEKDVDDILGQNGLASPPATKSNLGNSDRNDYLNSSVRQGDHSTEGCEKAVRDAGVGGMFGSFL